MSPESLEGFEDVLRHAAFTVLSRLQSGTEEVVRLDIALANLHAALATKSDAPATEPEGWRLVPVELTPEMAQVRTWDYNRFYPPEEIWKAMLAIAPRLVQPGCAAGDRS